MLLLARVMSMEIATLSHMEKLNMANFALWKAQMEDILIVKDHYLSIERDLAKRPSSMKNED